MSENINYLELAKTFCPKIKKALDEKNIAELNKFKKIFQNDLFNFTPFDFQSDICAIIYKNIVLQDLDNIKFYIENLNINILCLLGVDETSFIGALAETNSQVFDYLMNLFNDIQMEHPIKIERLIWQAAFLNNMSLIKHLFKQKINLNQDKYLFDFVTILNHKKYNCVTFFIENGFDLNFYYEKILIELIKEEDYCSIRFLSNYSNPEIILSNILNTIEQLKKNKQYDNSYLNFTFGLDERIKLFLKDWQEEQILKKEILNNQHEYLLKKL